jgi:hypothetical protein
LGLVDPKDEGTVILWELFVQQHDVISEDLSFLCEKLLGKFIFPLQGFFGMVYDF